MAERVSLAAVFTEIYPRPWMLRNHWYRGINCSTQVFRRPPLSLPIDALGWGKSWGGPIPVRVRIPIVLTEDRPTQKRKVNQSSRPRVRIPLAG